MPVHIVNLGNQHCPCLPTLVLSGIYLLNKQVRVMLPLLELFLFSSDIVTIFFLCMHTVAQFVSKAYLKRIKWKSIAQAEREVNIF